MYLNGLKLNTEKDKLHTIHFTIKSKNRKN